MNGAEARAARKVEWVVDGGVGTDWDVFVAGPVGGHHAQTSLWGAVQARQGWEVVRVVAREGGAIIGGAQVLMRPLRGLGMIGYLDKGPLLPVDRPGLVAEMIGQLKALARRYRIRLLIVQPPDHAFDVAEGMEAAGFGPTHVKTALAATVVVDLRSGTDAALGRMKSKTRYNIRLARRSDVTVRRGSDADIPVFHGLLESTAARQGFVPNSLEYLADLYSTFAPHGWSEIFIAEYEGRPIAGMLAISFGDTIVYKRGAWSGEEGKRRPNELLHWEVMEWAMTAGFANYDFDGIEPAAARAVLDGDPVPTSAVESVTRFKLGFGGDVLLLPETLSYVPNPVLRFGYDRVYPGVSRWKWVKRLVGRARVR